MGIFKFSMRMLVKDYKKSLFYGITLIFAVAVCFVFFNIINNPDLADQAIARSGGTWSDVQMPFSSVLYRTSSLLTANSYPSRRMFSIRTER